MQDMILTREIRQRIEAGAVLMAPGPYPHQCPNCGGMRIIGCFTPRKGPFLSPSSRSRWLYLPDGKSGWYQADLYVDDCPVCRGGQTNYYLEKFSGLEGEDLYIRLDRFRIDGELSGKKAALDVARSILGQNKSPGGFVTFHGGYGVGKTMLLKSLVNGFRLIEVPATYKTMANLLAEIREKFSSDNGLIQVENAIAHYAKARVLAIDEVERVNLTGWAQETIFRLLNDRYEAFSLLTILATNLDPKSLPDSLQYLASRMSSGLVVEVEGPDMRPLEGLNRWRDYAGVWH